MRLLRGWLPKTRADALLAWVRANAAWARERRTMYDRVVDVPREQAWFGEGGLVAPGGELDAIRCELETTCGARFAYVLANRYRNGADSVAWHSDREVERLQTPVIASLTLGATRAFDLRRKDDRSRVTSVDLDHGDLVVMAGETQRTYEHRVAKDARIAGERINLTFRQRPEARGANHA